MLGLKVEAVQGKHVSLEWTETSGGLWEWWPGPAVSAETVSAETISVADRLICGFRTGARHSSSDLPQDYSCPDGIHTSEAGLPRHR